MSHVGCSEVEVKAVLPSAGHPFVREYPADTPLGTIKAEILAAFGVRDEVVGGNTISFSLFNGGDKLTNMSATVGSLASNPSCKVQLRVVKDIVFGA